MSDKTELSEFEELLGQYWELAYSEGNGGNHDGSKANAVLSALRATFARRATIQPTAGQAVHQGRIHTANGHWSDITEAEAGMWKADGFTVRTLYTGPVAAPADAVRDARDLALEEAAKLAMDGPLIESCGEFPYMGDDCKAMALTVASRIRTLKSTPKEPVK